VRRLLPLVLAVLLGVALAACGDARKTTARKTTRSVSSQYTPSAKLGGVTPAAAAAVRHAELAKVAWVRSSPQPPLRNDGDHEEPGDEDHDNNHDTGTANNPSSIDPYLDYLPPANNHAYHDEDDQSPVEFGHPAGPGEMHAIDALVKRYYAAAAAGDGAQACSLMQPQFAKAVPNDYGRLGASYLRGGKTCAGVLSLLFKHFHRELTAAIQVTDARVSGPVALAFFGSRVMRASQISLRREGGAWTISQVFGSVLL
jgi:hypothetical protein